MGMSRCYSLMKCLLILFSIIFLLVGAVVCGFAAWALWDEGLGGGSGAGGARAGLCALLGWAVALELAALCALAGCARGSGALLAGGAALLALTAAAEAGAAWWGAAHLPQLRLALLERLDRTVRADYGVIPARTQLVDAIQHGLECCGASATRDWQGSAWARAAAHSDAPDAPGAPGAPGAPAAAAALDLSVSAPAAYYYVPPSCCATAEGAACEAARRVPAASGGARGLHAAACGARVLAALGRAVRAPLAAGAALLAAHAAALALALVLAVRARPRVGYKA